MFGPGYGTIAVAIASFAEAAGEKAPRDLWHALSFYTSGYVMEQAIAEFSDCEYTAYWRRT